MYQPLFSASGVADWRMPVREKKAASTCVFHFPRTVEGARQHGCF